MSKRLALIMAIAIAALSAQASLAARPKAHPAPKKVRPIAIVINGNQLSLEPPPKFYKGHLLVPVRRIIEALGLDFEPEGKRIVTHAGYKRIALTVGSKNAQIGSDEVELEAAPVEIKYVLYAPLRFFADALDAQAQFNRQTNSVEITSTLVGRSGSGIVSLGAAREYLGTVTAVDTDSDPNTVTLTYGASVRTVPLDAQTEVIVQDVNTGTSNPGQIADVHPGDFAQVYVEKSGRATRVVDAYGSRAGKVAASAAGELVLEDGHVIVPGRETTITLNGERASIGDIQIGDQAMVRYNIDSSDVRQIIATRRTTVPPQPSGPVAITSVDVSPSRPLKAGDVATVTVRGTPNGNATFDIGPYVLGLPMTENGGGTYTGRYVVKPGVNFADAPVFAHLRQGAIDAPVQQSLTTLSVSTEPPGVVDFAPDSGALINNNRPSVYATFATSTVPVNPSSETITVDGRDVTSQCIRTPRFIYYTPGIDYRQGPVDVVVRVADMAGNVATKRWTFYIKVR